LAAFVLNQQLEKEALVYDYWLIWTRRTSPRAVVDEKGAATQRPLKFLDCVALAWTLSLRDPLKEGDVTEVQLDAKALQYQAADCPGPERSLPKAVDPPLKRGSCFSRDWKHATHERVKSLRIHPVRRALWQ
jgi:hypothetical protein